MNELLARRDHFVGATLAFAYVALLLGTSSALGLSRDEGIYAVAADNYAAWFERLASDPRGAVTRTVVDAHWSYNHEHPALAKTVFALGQLVQEAYSPFARPSQAIRFGGMLSAGLLLWLIYVFGVRSHGRRVGLFAACAYALLPRPFYHAHLAAFDVPITLMVLWVVYAYWRSLARRRWAVACGVAFGLALATKHNSWILPGICLIHHSLTVLLDRRRVSRGAASRVSRFPTWLFAMLVIGPLLFVGSWPWLWFDTFARFGAYARFHLKHEYYNMAYFGVNYFWPPFPVSYPWVMTLYTVPLTTLALAMVGIGIEGRRTWSRSVADWKSAAGDSDARLTAVLWLGCLLAPLLLISLPSTPIFGGTKHWITAYPFMALFAGVAFDRILTAVSEFVSVRALPVVCGALLLLPGALETAHSHPFGLSHYGVAVGGVPGAADRGMNRQFWGFTTGSLVDYFKQALPDGGRVWICDTIGPAWHMLSRDDLLPDNIRATPHIAEADLVIVHHEHHFAEVDHQIWSQYGSVRPVHVLAYDGVPIISVYKNPRSQRVH